MFNNILATLTTYFTYSVSMEYSIREKKDLFFFFFAQEMVENICPHAHLGMIPYTRLVRESFSSTVLLRGNFQLSESAVDWVRSRSSLMFIF